MTYENNPTPFNRDDLAPEATISRAGTIKITDVETGESTIHATYAAEDILRLLAQGYSPADIAGMLERAEP